LLAVDAATIDHDVEDAASAGDQRRVDIELLLDRGRQTGGLRFVVSLHAVGDADFHDALSFGVFWGFSGSFCIAVFKLNETLSWRGLLAHILRPSSSASCRDTLDRGGEK